MGQMKKMGGIGESMLGYDAGNIGKARRSAKIDMEKSRKGVRCRWKP